MYDFIDREIKEIELDADAVTEMATESEEPGDLSIPNKFISTLLSQLIRKSTLEAILMSFKITWKTSCIRPIHTGFI